MAASGRRGAPAAEQAPDHTPQGVPQLGLTGRTALVGPSLRQHNGFQQGPDKGLCGLGHGHHGQVDDLRCLEELGGLVPGPRNHCVRGPDPPDSLPLKNVSSNPSGGRFQ